MEKALFILKSEDLSYWDVSYSRLYFGSEFCQNLIPGISQTDKILEFVYRHKLFFSLVTPYCAEEGIKKVEKLLKFLTAAKIEAEVVFNDFGTFRLLKEYKFLPVMGRLLTKQNRDPRISLFNLKQPQKWEHLKECAMLSQGAKEFLKDNLINRIEIDNLRQGIKLNTGLLQELHVSLFLPFCFITTGRFCVFKNDNFDASCQKECQELAETKLHHKAMPVELSLKGNTLYYRNTQPVKIKDRTVDRLVWQPRF